MYTHTYTVYSSGGFTQESHVVVKACVMMGWFCWTLAENDTDLCSIVSSASDDDGSSSCPAAGTYTFDKNFQIPGDSDWDFYYGYSTTIHAIMTTDSSTTTECKVTIQAEESSSSSYTMVAGAVAGVTLLAAVLIRKRRRTIAIPQDPLCQVEMTTGQHTSTQNKPSALV